MGGHLTMKILLEQGVPQGDIISPFIFIIAVEILLIKITNKTKVVPFGDNFNIKDKIESHLPLEWEKEFTLLGIEICNYTACYFIKSRDQAYGMEFS